MNGCQQRITALKAAQAWTPHQYLRPKPTVVSESGTNVLNQLIGTDQAHHYLGKALRSTPDAS